MTLKLDSREVAVMVGKSHAHLMRDIREYVEHMKKSHNPKLDSEFGDEISQSKIEQSDFFIESDYANERGKVYPNYQVTRKGCELIANKLTGKKGTLFTAAYINRFHEMEKVTSKIPHNIGEVVEMVHMTRESLREQGASATEIAAATKQIGEQCGIQFPDFFVKEHQRKMTDDEIDSMVDFVYDAKEQGLPLPTYAEFIGFMSKSIGSEAKLKGARK